MLFSLCRSEEDGGMNVSVRRGCLSGSEEYGGMFFFPPHHIKLFLSEVLEEEDGGMKGGINVSVRGSCSANRQQRLRCLRAETRILI